MVDVVIIGNVCFDEGYFIRKSGKYDKRKSLGGAGYFSAVGASLFANTGIVAKVGEDYDLNNFQKFLNIDISGIKKNSGEKTTTFKTVFHSLDGKNREITGDVPPNLLLNKNDIIEKFMSAKAFHIATNEPEIQIELIKQIRKFSNALISIDTIKYYADNPLTLEAFNMADIAIVEDCFSALQNTTTPIKIIKHGKNGVDLISNGEPKIFENQNIIKNVVDKTGAGDVFAGSLMANIAKGKDIFKSITIAMDTATNSIKDYGVEHLHQNINQLN